uniref:Golgi apparatus membrane protein TVP23 homolog n=1 Tax=Triatoma infestans TaxID=30076 RepID=A0A023F8K3_TRIIF
MSTLVEDDTIPFGLEHQNNKTLPHPYVTMCHIGFRSAALLVYFLCGLFSDSYITNFVVIVLLLSVDFWTVKNITGRLMVGLRWWNYIDDEGKSHWVYESKKGASQNMVNSTEVKIFWAGLISFPAIWGIIFIIKLFSLQFKWVLLISIAATLNGANLHGYLKCRFGKNNENFGTSLTNVTSSFFRQQVLQNMTNLMNTTTSPQSTTQMNPNHNIV